MSVCIRLGIFDGGKNSVPASMDWPASLDMLQGGTKGIVLSKKGNYRTAYVEAFIENSFFRGEGATITEAEKDCWEKYSCSKACVKHEWESRGYRNGGGFCKHCKKFSSNVFTATELGMFCAICNKPTVYAEAIDATGVLNVFCEEHIDQVHADRLLQLHEKGMKGVLSELEKKELRSLEFFL